MVIINYGQSHCIYYNYSFLPGPPPNPLVLPPPNKDPVPLDVPFPVPLPGLLCPVLLLPNPNPNQDNPELADPLFLADPVEPRPGELFTLDVGLLEPIPPELRFGLDPVEP